MYFGTILLNFSLVVSIFCLICCLFNSQNKKSLRLASEALFFISGAAIIIAVVLLYIAFLTDRFDLDYVYSYSSSGLSVFYKIAAFWAGQEGTFLLWVFLLFIFGSIIIKAKDEYEDLVLGIIVITQIFILIVLSVHSPFEFIWDASPDHFKPGLIPHDGSGLNPLLQNPWMMIHPPVLFLGYASATIPFAYTIAGLIKRDYSTLIKKSYKWVVFCMTTLGIGIFLGAYWAYIVLGWGGYWGWDPVENSSLIPWLMIVALMHGLIVQKRKGALIKTNIFLSIISFVLIFYGTFLTRSGVLSDFSVHSFGDLGLSGYLIFFILFFLFIGMGLYLLRFRDIKSNPLSEKLLTVDNLINYGIITLIFYSFFILLGTSMPIISKLLLPNPSSVTTQFYNTISIPLGILILGFLTVAGVYQFIGKLEKRNLIITAVSSVIIGGLLNIFNTVDPFSYIFIIISIFIIIQSVQDLLKYKTINIRASRIPHIGVGILVIGVITSNIHSYSVQKMLHQDEEKKIQDIGLTFKGIKRSIKSSLMFVFSEDGSEQNVETLYYNDMKTNSLYKEPYIRYGFFNDIYISPIEYINGEEKKGQVQLSKGVEKKVEGMTVKLVGFDVDKQRMMSGKPIIYAKLDLKINKRNYKLSPGVIIRGKKSKEYIDVKIPGTKRKISLVGWDINQKKIAIYIEPEDLSIAAPDIAIVDVSFKRLIWLVWLGTILISIGGFVAYRRSTRSS